MSTEVSVSGYSLTGDYLVASGAKPAVYGEERTREAGVAWDIGDF